MHLNSFILTMAKTCINIRNLYACSAGAGYGDVVSVLHAASYGPEDVPKPKCRMLSQTTKARSGSTNKKEYVNKTKESSRWQFPISHVMTRLRFSILR